MGVNCMQYRTWKNGKSTSVLGLGTMRLPILEGDATNIDEPKAIQLIRESIEGGINYIDTAYVYHGGKSETVVGKALLDGYRDKVTLVTKLPPWVLKTESDMDKILDEQLVRLQTNQLDIYLLHALDEKGWNHLKSLNVFDFMNRVKKDGRVSLMGFSFHGPKELFKEILEAYPWDVCMIQMNYIDQDTQATVDGIQWASEKEIPVIIMEPLKGGQLAKLPDSIQETFDRVTPGRNGVEWSFKWLANFEGVKTILSGMTYLEQLHENLKIADTLFIDGLTPSEIACYETARKQFDARVRVACTQCNYCMPCPVGVQIPKNFKLLNEAAMYNATQNAAYTYQKMMRSSDRASACIACRACESKCPQQIEISEALKEVDLRLNSQSDYATYQWSY